MSEKTSLNLQLELRVKYNTESNDLEEYFLVNGLNCYRSKELDKAASFFKKASELNPEKKYYKYLQQICMYDSELSSNGQDDPDSQNSKGTLLFKLGLYEDAVNCFLRAIAVDPNTPLYYFNNANALKHLDAFDQANVFFDQAIQLDPLNSLYLYSKEINDIDKELKLNPDDHKLINIKGCFLLKLKDYPNAAIEFEKAIHLDSEKADYYYHKGIAASELGRFEEAHRCFETAKTLDSNKIDFSSYQQINMINREMKSRPRDAELFHCKAKLLHELTDFAAANFCFSKAIKLNPNKYEYYLGKAKTLKMMDHKEESLKYFTIANELYARK